MKIRLLLMILENKKEYCMTILHCILHKEWNCLSQQKKWGYEYLNGIGYVPCCTYETLKYVKKYLLAKGEVSEYLILVLDTKLITSEIRWEEWKNSQNIYPHVYGLIDSSAVVELKPLI